MRSKIFFAAVAILFAGCALFQNENESDWPTPGDVKKVIVDTGKNPPKDWLGWAMAILAIIVTATLCGVGIWLAKKKSTDTSRDTRDRQENLSLFLDAYTKNNNVKPETAERAEKPCLNNISS